MLRMKSIFCLKINVKLILSFQVCRQACLITQNNKFAISLQYLKEEVSDEIDFLQANKHKSLLQIDTMTLIGVVKHSQSFPNSKVAISLQYIKKEVRKGVHFQLADEHQSFYKLGLLFLMEVTRYVQSTQNMKLVILLQRVLQNCFFLW